MNKLSHQNAFGVVELLISILVIVSLVAIGWVAYGRLAKLPTPPRAVDITSQLRAPLYDDWKVYSNKDGGFTFKYPSDWSSEVSDEITLAKNSFSDSTFGGISGTLTSPSGHTLSWIYYVVGGKDFAECTSPAKETPFASANVCDSKQTLSVQQISSVKPANATSPFLFEDRLYITATKYQQGTWLDGKEHPATYQICLDPYSNDQSSFFPKVGTEMGHELPCDFYSTGFNVEFDAKDAADLNSPDAQTARLIMRSFGTV